MVTFFKLALPTLLRTTLDLAQVQVVAVFAARLGSTQAGTHNTLIQLYAVFSAWAFGMCDGVAVRVGFNLGNGEGVRACVCCCCTYVCVSVWIVRAY